MAFQTNVFRDGQWVTETVSLEAALNASVPTQQSTEGDREPPKCGILSRTVVESPVVRWVLPVRLRSSSHNDIAFIGTNFVQISELQPDGQIYPVLRRNDFVVRIRNAVVIGGGLETTRPGHPSGHGIKTEDLDMTMHDSMPLGRNDMAPLPPQMLVLIFETCEMAFLIVRKRPDGTPEFFTTYHKPSADSAHIGYHLTVNPSWRYLVAASPNGVFVVHELESIDNMRVQYARDGTFEPVRSFRARTLRGTITNAAFLHPRPQDHDHHVILLLTVVHKDRDQPPVTRMMAYDWYSGDNLKSTLARKPITSRLPDEYSIPVHVIPLTVQSAFIVVSEREAVIVAHFLSGSPGYSDLISSHIRSTPLHHGRYQPLWSSWARPYRRDTYFEKTDIIYLAREDGTVIHLEIDSESLAPSVTNKVFLDANIDTAFAVAHDPFSDVLIIGGDSGPGGIWKLQPRKEVVRVSTLPNWSPVVDMAVLKGGQSCIPGTAKSTTQQSARQTVMPDRMFSASGRGLKGSVTEWRRGFQARIGVEIDSGELIRKSWVFTNPSDQSLCSLLALPHSSMVLCFSGDLGEVESPDNTPFDTSSRTLHASQSAEGIITQVTETSITLGDTLTRQKFSYEQLLGEDIVVEQAFCIDNLVVLSTHRGGSSKIHTLRLDRGGFSHVRTWVPIGEVTALSLFRTLNGLLVTVATIADAQTWLSIYHVDGTELTSTAVDLSLEQIPGTNASGLQGVDVITSMCVVCENESSVDFIVGTRCGRLTTFNLEESPATKKHLITWTTETIGISPVEVFPASATINGSTAAFACCDDHLIMLSEYSKSASMFKCKQYIWPTDSNQPSMPSLPIHWAYDLGKGLSDDTGNMSVMLLAGSKVLLADIWPHPGPVPRTMPVEGTPTRIIYSKVWNCLVVGLLVDGSAALTFLDAETGAVISTPCDQNKRPVKSISGLGKPGDKIFGLHEWSFTKEEHIFCFLLVTTKLGNLVVVSAKMEQTETDDGPGRQLRFWTKSKKSLGRPIYSVTGHGDGVIYCVDKTIHWDVLDIQERKLKTLKTFELDSPVTSLLVERSRILALTTMHSLVVLNHREEEPSEQMELAHAEAVSRATLHMINVGDHVPNDVDDWPMMLLSDTRGGVAGVWVPWGRNGHELNTGFSGFMPSVVRRFVRGRVRPFCLAVERQGRYGSMPSSRTGEEVLGVSVDGSLTHFTLLSLGAWRLLKLIQTLAQESARLYAFPPQEPVDDLENQDFEGQSEEMGIDGDLLDRCLKSRALKELVGRGRELELFCQYLDELDSGRWTTSFRNLEDDIVRQERYISLGCEVLEYYMASPL